MSFGTAFQLISKILLLFFIAAMEWDFIASNPLSTNCSNGICHNTSQPGLRSTTTSYDLLLRRFNASSHSSGLHNFSTTNKPNVHLKHKTSESIKVAKLDYFRVETHFTICFWILLASIAKIVFHYFTRVSSLMPESCLLILLGVPIGIILRAAGMQQFYFTSNLFFLCLLPPIILDAGYFMPVKLFYLNIGTILLYATVGTIFNSFAMGALLYGLQGLTSINYSLMHAFLFGSLISAVDPVAVLAVFEEVHVHEVLYILVFGECVLNDAASVVLYHTFEAMANMSVVTFKQVVLAIVSFFVVSVGGTFIGIIWGIATSFVTRFTEHVRVIEPIFIFVMSYMAYLTAEIFHFSGIMAILFCGIIMKPYVESNVSRKSRTTIKYFLKLLSTCCETIIFMFLGVCLVVDNHRWNPAFICITLVLILVVRTVGVIILTAIANWNGRVKNIGRTEQFIMSYGGLRGAVAFCLAILLDKEHMNPELREMLITTTMMVVLFTVFVQGTTIKPLVRFLKIKRNEKQEMTMTCVINDRILDHVNAGMEEVLGHHGHGYWREIIDHFNKKYFRKWLEREPDQALDEEIILANRKIAYKFALSMAQNPSAMFQKTDEWSAVKRNPSYAVALAMRENCDLTENQPRLDTGVLNVRTMDELEEGLSHNISIMIPRARAPKLSIRARTLATRRYTLESLDEPDDEIPYRHNKVKRNALAHMMPPGSHGIRQGSINSQGGRKHKHHRRRHRSSGKRDNNAFLKVPAIPLSTGRQQETKSRDDFDDLGITFKVDINEEEHDANSNADTLLMVPSASEPVKDTRAVSVIGEEDAVLNDADDVVQEKAFLLHRPSEESKHGHLALQRQKKVLSEEETTF